MSSTDLPDTAPEGWTRATDGTALQRRFTFDTFSTAMAFMVAAAAHAERADHHPEWRNVYTSVEVRLTTHATGGITDKDVALALAMNRVAAALT